MLFIKSKYQKQRNFILYLLRHEYHNLKLTAQMHLLFEYVQYKSYHVNNCSD